MAGRAKENFPVSDTIPAQVEPANSENPSDPVLEELIVPGMFSGAARFSRKMPCSKQFIFST